MAFRGMGFSLQDRARAEPGPAALVRPRNSGRASATSPSRFPLRRRLHRRPMTRHGNREHHVPSRRGGRQADSRYSATAPHTEHRPGSPRAISADRTAFAEPRKCARTSEHQQQTSSRRTPRTHTTSLRSRQPSATSPPPKTKPLQPRPRYAPHQPIASSPPWTVIRSTATQTPSHVRPSSPSRGPQKQQRT